MKRIIAIVLSFLLLSAHTARHQGVNAPHADFEAQYIRTGVRTEITGYPMVSVIHSFDELTAYYAANRERFDLERRQNVASDSTIGFLDACDEYDAAFFESNALVFVVVEEVSGSIRHKVDHVKTDTEGKLCIDIRPIVPEIGTDDMAQWHIIVAIEKNIAPAGAEDVLIYYGGKRTTNTADHSHEGANEEQTVSNPISGYCGNTQTTVYFADNTSYTFMYSESVTLTDILFNLAYDRNKLCDCMPEYRVDTEFGTGYGISLIDGYARCDKGQADLTEDQIKTVKEIIAWAKEKAQ